MPRRKKNLQYTVSRPCDFTILLAGQAGQGIATIEKILVRTLKKEGFFVAASQEYMSRVRGGINATQIRIADVPIAAPVRTADLFVPLDSGAYTRYADCLTEKTRVLGNHAIVAACGSHPYCSTTTTVDFDAIATEAGNRLYANTAAAGVILGMIGASLQYAEDAVDHILHRKGQAVLDGNRIALTYGYKHGAHAAFFDGQGVPCVRTRASREDILLSGTEAIALGALAAGVNFCPAYPMSPSTGVFTFLAQHARECNIVVEQVADEIEAINMAIGASYAGARSLITTAGGGFALMEEGISLAAMTETPITVHLAQRPGPATGLPTRTAQEDLLLALYAGHGEFARAIYAPGTAEQAFALMQRAVMIAQMYQIPTFVLTDQDFLDRMTIVAEADLPITPIERGFVPTTRTYARYAETKDGISPRGIPGFGEDGYVCADSDEHDASGHITEDLPVRMAMVEKRLKRMRALRRCALLPSWYGPKDAKTVFVVWGSSYAAAREARDRVPDASVAIAHFSQVYPLSARVPALFARAQRIVVAEGNATGQFATIFTQETGRAIDDTLLRYDGAPFTVEDFYDAMIS